MIKKVSLLLLVATTLLFSGCINSIKLNEQAIVQAISLDLQEDKILLGLQIFSPSKSGEGKIGASTDNAKLIEATGENISDAIKNSNIMQGKQIFTGHNRIIVIGEELAQKGLVDILKYFSTNALSRKNVNISIAKGKAIDIIKAKLNQGMLPADTLEKIISNTNKQGYASNVLLYELERSLKNQHNSAILPCFSAIEEKKDEKKSGDKKEQIEPVSNIKLNGCGIITHDGLIDILTEQETRGVLWIRDNISSTSVDVSTENVEHATVEIFNTKSKIIPQFNDDIITFELNISCRATLGEVLIKKDKKISTDEIIKIQEAAAEKIKKECMLGFSRAFVDNKADIFNFGSLIWKNNKEIWLKVKDDWANTSKNIKLIVKPKVDIDSVGLEFNKVK